MISRSSPGVLLAFLIGSAVVSLSAQELETTQLAPGLYLVQGAPNGNVLFQVQENGLLMVDAQTSANAVALDDEIRRVTSVSPRLLINTHYHEDHIGGNDVFRSRGAVVVGHHNLTARAVVDTTITELGWHRQAADRSDLPDRTVSPGGAWSPPGTDVRVMALGSAHTDTDVVVFFPRENVLHTGDLVELVAPPFVDWWGGGSLDGLIDAVDHLLSVSNATTRFVPGHGAVIGRSEIERYRGFLTAVQAGVTDAIGQGLSMQQTADLGLTDRWGIDPDAGRRFVMVIYFGMTTTGS